MMERAQLASHALRVRIDGPSGAPWLVLSNSLGAALEMWEPQVAEFSRDHRVLRYDTRGHGQSSMPARPWSLASLGADVVALLDALDIERAHFCGLSMGGATGMWLASHARERIDRLVLCNTNPWLVTRDAMEARIAQVQSTGMEPLVEPTLRRWFTPGFSERHPDALDRIRQQLRATSVEGYVGCCEALLDADLRANLPRITTPTMVIAGTHDAMPAIETAREWAATIPGARFVELSAAHLSNIEAAAAFNSAVLEFLAA